MKVKDWVISLFLSGLLGYALCFRAGLFGSSGTQSSLDQEVNVAVTDTVRFRNWVFSAHKQQGLTILSDSGSVLYRFPEVRVTGLKIDAVPDTAGNTPGFIRLRSTCGLLSSIFRISPDGRLEAVNG